MCREAAENGSIMKYIYGHAHTLESQWRRMWSDREDPIALGLAVREKVLYSAAGESGRCAKDYGVPWISALA